MKEKLKKMDKALIGVLLGVLLPIVGFIISYFVKTIGTDVDFAGYVARAIHSNEQQDIFIFSMLPNMFLFYFTNFRWNLLEFTKGLVAVTILLGLMLVLLTVF
ncbi:MAG: hypothetical protein ACI8ZM_002330 [Crocinitomix sp.]|jgi:hypothetical protein